jgi:quercetin dioxygenase-like cupin family protein
MDISGVTRELLIDHALPAPHTTGHVEVRRITMPPGFAPGAHRHSGPVFGVIERGSAVVQVEGAPAVRLGPGEVFSEPADTVIRRFDATEEGVVFLGWFLLGPGEAPAMDAVAPE